MIMKRLNSVKRKGKDMEKLFKFLKHKTNHENVEMIIYRDNLKEKTNFKFILDFLIIFIKMKRNDILKKLKQIILLLL